MHPFFPRIGKSTLIEAALGIVLLHTPLLCNDFDDDLGFLSSPPAKGGKKLELLPEEKEIHNTPTFKNLEKNKDTYTINFNNISIVEYIRFTSKITNLNFIFDEDELQFNVSIVSEEPVTPRNIMSILIQVLRIHGLVVLEQDNNLLITRVRSVTQLATVISSDLPNPKYSSPIVTRVFRIKNANLNTVATVIKPMLSDSALLEVSAETKQLIITDITTNVDKISSLLATIDVPHTSLEIEAYVVQNVGLDILIPLATQIITPFAEGNPITFVPQPDTSTIFIVSTPYLIERALAILEDLDTPTQERKELATRDQVVFLYPLQHKKGDLFLDSIEELGQQLQSRGASYKLVDCLKEARWIKESNSILFIGDSDTIARIKEFLPTLGSESVQPAGLFVYKIQHVSANELENNLEALVADLQKSPQPDHALIETLTTFTYVKDTDSLIFTGSDETLERVKTLLEPLDGGVTSAGIASRTFYLYKLHNVQGNEIIDHLDKISANLQNSKVPDHFLITTLNDARWIKESNSILLTGTPNAIEQTRTIIEQFDVQSPTLAGALANKSAFFIYQPVHQKGPALESALKNLGKELEASGLTDLDLLNTINTMRYAEKTNSLLFTGTADSLAKVKTLVEGLDMLSSEQAQIQQLGQITFLIYRIQYVPAPQLIASLRSVTSDLQKTAAIDPQVVASIESLRWIKDTNSLMITGTNETLQKVEALLKKFDVASLAPRAEAVPTPSQFVIYTPKYQPGEDLIAILKEFEQNLVASGVHNRNLFDTISHVKYVARTCSLIISGDEESIAKVEELLRRFDVPTSTPSQISPAIETIQNTSFLIYKLQYHQGSEILTAIKQIATDLTAGTAISNQNLLNAVNSLQWIRVTNSLLASGEPETLTKLRDLIQNLDVPLRQVFIEILVIETNVNNTQNFGLQWGGKMQYLNKFAAGSGNFPTATTSPASTSNPVQPWSQTGTNGIAPGINATNATTFPKSSNIPFLSGWDLGVIGDIIMHKGRSFISLGSLVNALQSDTDSTVVLNPKIITQDNRTSTIFVGNNIPFIGSQVTTNANIVASTNNIEYRDIGFNLTITPTIGNGDVVTLDINTDISQVTSNPQIATSGASGSTGQITGIQTSHTSMTTKVHVPDKHFVVLSGMIQDTKARFKSGIPCLGGLPVIGVIFSETDRAAIKQNLIFFIRPHVINTYDEYKEITERQEATFKENAVLPVLKEEFDAGIDIVNYPED